VNQIGNNHLGVNLTFAKFVFITPREEDDAARTRLRAVGATVARGFFNDFDAQNGADSGPHETIQFFTANGGPRPAGGLGAARYVVQICSKYRPRLAEAELELRRRIGEHAQIAALDGATRVPQYTSAEMFAYAYKQAMIRTTGRLARNVIILPIRKSPEWWAMAPLQRHSYFYPHTDGVSQQPAKGHAVAAEIGISTVYRRLYYHPDGHGQDGCYDFITYFECADEHLETFDRVRRNLRDVTQNPEWRYVIEGPEWRGHRVLRW
jgi:hypothetical protein